MKTKTTFELIQRLKTIEVEKWNLEAEKTVIMQELWERVDSFEAKEEEKPKSLIKENKNESKNN